GSGGSRLISGNSTLHRRLERELAALKRADDAIVFPTGFQANLGTISALAGRGDAVFSDELNHASIIDGCRLSRAETFVYRHGDVEHLSWGLQKAGERAALIVTDGVFSMDGDVAPLTDLLTLARRHACRLMVDEAHATGALGPGGRGSVAAAGLSGEVDVVMGTLGKALGSYGAYVCADRETTDYLLNTARSFVFSTALPPPVAAAGLAALELLESQPERVERLTANATTLRQALIGEGLAVDGSETQIVPVAVGDAKATMELSGRVLERGVFAQGIRPPTVPVGSSRLRFTVMSTHRREELEHAARVVGAAARELGIGADRPAVAQLAA
ncbi:MAG TPA: 8-amino-7-oxononanoate synthase, partial [Solirubrobacterales bacterium]|nr:8-amino-7-oxononanoate synthase [Solirubrobacterales bacterium]